MQELTSTEIKFLIKKAGFKSKAEFARELGLLPKSVNNWGSCTPAPVWFKKVIQWAKVYNETKQKELFS